MAFTESLPDPSVAVRECLIWQSQRGNLQVLLQPSFLSCIRHTIGTERMTKASSRDCDVERVFLGMKNNN